MLKILLVYYEPLQSGQTTHVLSLVNGLEKDRYDLTLILPEHLKKTLPQFQQTGIRVIPLAMGKVLWKFDSLRQFIQLIRREQFDIVHIHSQEAGLISRILTIIAGAKHVIYTPQTIDIGHSRWHWLYILFERILATVTDKIVSVNQIDRERLLRWGIPPEKVVTIPNSIDPSLVDVDDDRTALRRQLGLNPSDRAVMQVARLSPQKNPFAFVDGASLVLKECPDVKFVMIGNGPLEGQVQEYIRERGLDSRVSLVGWCDQAFKVISVADLLTLTSRWEGTPYSLLEAMAWSKPVVATAVNGCKEVVLNGDTGFLIPPGDICEWASRIIELIKDPERATKMGQCGRSRVEKMYHRDVMIRRIEKLYALVVEKNGSETK